MKDTKKKNKKGTTLSLAEFHGSEPSYVKSNSSVAAASTSNWADLMEEEELSTVCYSVHRRDVDLNQLPTTSRASRGPDIDKDLLPTEPPYTAHVSNLPYDAMEEQITNFFKNVKVLNVNIPKESGERDRHVGYGYVEFETLAGLIEGLSFDETMMGTRTIKVNLPNSLGGDRKNMMPAKADADDDWRRGPPVEVSSADNDRSGGRGFGNFNRDDNSRSNKYDDCGRVTAPESGTWARAYNPATSSSSSSFGRRNGPSDDSSFGRSYGDRRDGGSSYRSRTGCFDRSDMGRDRNYGSSRDGGGYSEISRPSRDSAPVERKKLNLKPRSENLPPTPVEETKGAALAGVFGKAKPVDTLSKEREIEDRLRKERDGFLRRQAEPTRNMSPSFSERSRDYGSRDNYRGNRQNDQSGYRDRGGYRDQGGYRDRGGYQDQGGYRDRGGYQDQGGYRDRGGYQDQGGYRDRGGYQDQGGYRDRGGYRDQGGYRDRGGYQDQGGYRDRGGYQDQGGYRDRGGYQDQGGYRDRGGYQDQGGYRDRGGYQDQGGYRDQDNYRDHGGYRDQGSNRDQGGYRDDVGNDRDKGISREDPGRNHRDARSSRNEDLPQDHDSGYEERGNRGESPQAGGRNEDAGSKSAHVVNKFDLLLENNDQ